MAQTFPPRSLDYGYPDLTAFDDAAWLSVFAAGFARHKEEIETIAAAGEPATVANTLHAFGRSGALLNSAMRAFSCVYSAHATEARQQVYAELAPQRAAHEDWIALHPQLNARFRQLHDRLSAGEVEASAEQRWMLQQQLVQAEAAGAALNESDRARLLELNQRLAAEETAYQQLQSREVVERALFVQRREELEGLDSGQIDAAAAAAKTAGHRDGYLLSLTMPVQQQALAQLQNRQTRRRLHEASVGRGSLAGDDGRTTYDIGASIASLRAQKAQLLGFSNYFESVLPLRTAPSTEAVKEMLEKIAAGAVQRLQREASTIAETSGLGDDLAAWDMSYWIHRLKPVPASAEAESATPAFPITLDQALTRVFDAAQRTYGIHVVEREDLPGFVPGARSFEVFDGAPGDAGTGIGLFLLDIHSRPTKSGGAWMNSFAVASELTGTRPVVINCLNVSPPAPGQPTMLSAGEHKTLFHEFGHALHGLLAAAEFEELSGTAVPRDNVEFPSQVNEVFQDLYSPTPTRPGAVPSERELWGKGLSTVEHVAAVVIDIAWHSLTPDQAEEALQDPRGFEQRALAEWGLDLDLVPPRYSSGFFKHIFASSGYAAGYYSYLWAEVLAADASEWFREVLNDEAALARRGAHFRTQLLSRGNTRDPLESYRQAVGRDPQVEPLLRSLGLA
ncbi:M3 family metallopeptidase [Nesterenkonia massiliensis]|uniref:M3 family metallopeptidase n=1 Tax=Nesterenkonia massiliensis TaxID=1232429 RepID=UPI00041451F9|nr:M3 family metallopeptidase [Nesterenkonia massiliensis]